MHRLEIRRPHWNACYLEVTDIDFNRGYVYGIIKDLKTGEIRDACYSAPIKGWVPVLSVQDVLSSV